MMLRHLSTAKPDVKSKATRSSKIGGRAKYSLAEHKAKVESGSETDSGVMVTPPSSNNNPIKAKISKDGHLVLEGGDDLALALLEADSSSPYQHSDRITFDIAAQHEENRSNSDHITPVVAKKDVSELVSECEGIVSGACEEPLKIAKKSVVKQVGNRFGSQHKNNSKDKGIAHKATVGFDPPSPFRNDVLDPSSLHAQLGKESSALLKKLSMKEDSSKNSNKMSDNASTAPVIAHIRGFDFDITGLGIDVNLLESLPEEEREVLLLNHIVRPAHPSPFGPKSCSPAPPQTGIASQNELWTDSNLMRVPSRDDDVSSLSLFGSNSGNDSVHDNTQDSIFRFDPSVYGSNGTRKSNAEARGRLNAADWPLYEPRQESAAAAARKKLVDLLNEHRKPRPLGGSADDVKKVASPFYPFRSKPLSADIGDYAKMTLAVAYRLLCVPNGPITCGVLDHCLGKRLRSASHDDVVLTRAYQLIRGDQEKNNPHFQSGFADASVSAPSSPPSVTGDMDRLPGLGLLDELFGASKKPSLGADNAYSPIHGNDRNKTQPVAWNTSPPISCYACHFGSEYFPQSASTKEATSERSYNPPPFPPFPPFFPPPRQAMPDVRDNYTDYAKDWAGYGETFGNDGENLNKSSSVGWSTEGSGATFLEPQSKDLAITYWVTIESENDTIHVPTDGNNVFGREKEVANSSMKKVWKWAQEKKLGDKIGLQSAFDLANEMHQAKEEEHDVTCNGWGCGRCPGCKNEAKEKGQGQQEQCNNSWDCTCLKCWGRNDEMRAFF